MYLSKCVILKDGFVHVDCSSFKNYFLGIIFSAWHYGPLERACALALHVKQSPESQGLGPGHPQVWPGTQHTVGAHVALVKLNVKGKVAPCARLDG